MNVTSFGNRFFADNQFKMCALGWALIQYHCVLIKRGKLDTETHTQTYTHTGKPHYKHEGRDWGNKSTNQGTPANY